ncbi:MAG: A/G-specific adenine glycosylase [Acidimicrobiia bacterium]|nr:A/G-specific adenine glycosylase [Acidimicrobiia bacterium]
MAPSERGAGLDVGVDLLAWFELNGRSLPWRESRDPWAVLVSELMLQQTQVSRVIDRWPRFLRRFPDVASCAGAPVAEVITEWAGLGYNRRAVNLHRTARILVADHGGRFPAALSDLLALPGVGPYTARAIRVFASETDDAVLDTNVARILARAEGRALGRAEAQRLADAAVPAGQGWVWNQALLDVGAGHCTARDPRCDGCPLAPSCRWYLDGRPDPDPATGSAGVSGPQSRFAGSDRQGRGRLVAALRAGPVPVTDLPAVVGWPDDPDRAARVAHGVVRDGLAVLDGSTYALPR